MKKQQIAAAACLVAGAIGFAAVYSTQKPGKDEIPTEISQTSSIVEPTEKKTPQKTTEKVDSETKMGQEESAAGQQEMLLRNAIQQSHDFALISCGKRKEFHIDITAEDVDVMYQPMGTFYSVTTDQFGNLTNDLKTFRNSDLLVFDCGFKTLDKFVIQNKKLEEKDTDENLGMKRILEETRNSMQEDLKKKGYSVSVSLPAMQQCLKNGVVRINDRINFTVKEFPIEEYLKKANELICKEAFDSIKDYVFSIKYLIMTGGTGSAWYGYFKDKLKGIHTLKVISGDYNSNLPAFYANARGYYMYRLTQFKVKR